MWILLRSAMSSTTRGFTDAGAQGCRGLAVFCDAQGMNFQALSILHDYLCICVFCFPDVCPADDVGRGGRAHRHEGNLSL